MATVRDIREIISKLSSDKAKAREEGVRLLSSWLEGERSIGFCRLLTRNTARIKPGAIPSPETWPFLLTLLTKCIALEISASKKRHPKIMLAKTLRATVQCAEDLKLSGQSLLLFSIARTLFDHIWDVTKDISSFQSEYGSILRHLLTVKEYRYQMRKRIYCNLVVLYARRVLMGVNINSNSLPCSKEELFRYILTLHALLEYPPGDFPDNIREDVVKGFCEIFAHVRDEGKVSRKLMECLNAYLLKDGANLGYQAEEIHSSVQDFLFRCWLTSHDRAMKNSFIIYARVLLRLNRGTSDENHLVEQLMDILIKELDQSINSGSAFLWAEMLRDEKAGLAGNIQGLMDLAAMVFYKACKYTPRKSCKGKCLKVEHAAVLIEDRLSKGSWLWIAAVSSLIHAYGFHIDKAYLIRWFETTLGSLNRILNNANAIQFQDTLLWLLRVLLEFSALLVVHSQKEHPQYLSLTSSEMSLVRNCWQDIWNSLMHGLPILSTATLVVDSALNVLSSIILRDQIDLAFVPEDVWGLQIFKNMQSLSALYFVTCYFSRVGFQGNLLNALFIRKNMLRAALGIINSKEPSLLNERSVLLIPDALFSLSAGCAVFTSMQSASVLLSVHNNTGKLLLMEGCQGLVDDIEFSIAALAEIKSETLNKVKSEPCHRIHLPRIVRQPLLLEIMESIITFATSNKEFDRLDTSVLIYVCSLFCNIICCTVQSRLKEEKSLWFTTMFVYLSEVLSHIVSVVEDRSSEIQSQGLDNMSTLFFFSASTLPCLCSLLSSQLFTLCKNNSDIYYELLQQVVQSLDELLVALSKLYGAVSTCITNLDAEIDIQMLPPSSLNSPPDSTLIVECKSQIVDMDLDATNDSNDVDGLTDSGSRILGSSSLLQCRLELVSMMATFFSVLPHRTWEILYNLMEKENDSKIWEHILFILCKNFHGPAGSFTNLVNFIDNTMEKTTSSKLGYFISIGAIHALLRTLASIRFDRENCDEKQCLNDMVSHENLNVLADVVNKVAANGIPDWFLRVKLIDCILCFISLEPSTAQVMIERLLSMLHDNDYRVRLFLARKIGILFQTWDGHNELLHDICLSFGVELVRYSDEKLVKVRDVLAAGPQPVPVIETALITLAHLALYGDTVEVECVFMMCAVATIEPCQRGLICALLDNLSRQLRYASRCKYLEQLMGSILARWVACDVGLVALSEVMDLFDDKSSDPKYFINYCCPWLLPPLVLRGDESNLDWVSKVSSQPLSALIKEYFVPIFAMSMAAHCSEREDKEVARAALCESILHYGEISELERDDLIKKHMVAIVSFLFSLTSSAAYLELPFFAKEIVVLAVKTVVDGFVEMDDNRSATCVVDKINIFRPDRVFKFLVEMHYQITAACHPRHMCHRLSAIEVLVDVLGHRVIVSSTFHYIISIVGNFIGIPALQDQCCMIVSKLVDAFIRNPANEAVSDLGKELQFLISKLVLCFIPLGNQGEKTTVHSSGIMPLLHKLTVDADPSLYECIKQLEPFPNLDCFTRIQTFQSDLCLSYSPRDQFLQFVKRAPHLPPRLLLLSLQKHHKNLVFEEIICRQTTSADKAGKSSYWNSDSDVVSSVWTLVNLCSSSIDSSNTSEVLADFISRVGISDAHQVVFRLPTSFDQKNPIELPSSVWTTESKSGFNFVVCELLLSKLLGLLRKYLSDDSVKIVDVTSQTLRGILSTEKGWNALLSLDPHEKSILEVHSKGVNMAIVEKKLSSEKISSVSLEDSSLWQTEAKTYDTWVCSLVHSLISHCDDIILRICQNIVLLKAEVAELLLASVLVNLAEKPDSNAFLCGLISTKVQENIFLETNHLIKSVQIFLNALNKVRSSFVIEKAASLSTTLKNDRPPTSSRTHWALERSKDRSANALRSTFSWEKVYWLSVDYLVVAKAAIRCGSYFTAVMYAELWCDEHFNGITLGSPDFSHQELLPPHIDIMVAAFTQINEPDSIYGIIRTNQMTTQIIRFEHERNWSKALELYDLLVRSVPRGHTGPFSGKPLQDYSLSSSREEDKMMTWDLHKGLMRSLQKNGCTHLLDLYCHGLNTQRGYYQLDSEFVDIQYEAAWRAGNWDFSLFVPDSDVPHSTFYSNCNRFNEDLHSCLKGLHEGNTSEFHMKLTNAKKDLVFSLWNISKESTKYIHSTIVKLQMLDHLNTVWDLRGKLCSHQSSQFYLKTCDVSPEPGFPRRAQLESLNGEWRFILQQAQVNLDLLEPFIAFRRVLLQILDCKECTIEHLLQSASTLRKGTRFSLAAAALHELKELCCQAQQPTTSHTYFLARLEEAKLLRAQGQHDMAISLGKFILQNCQKDEEIHNVYRLVGKWLAETRSSSSRTIIEQYLKHSVKHSERSNSTDKRWISRRCQAYFHLAHYTDGLFKSYEERLASSEWQAAMRLRKHKTKELDVLIKRLKSSSKGEKTDLSVKILELQKLLAMDREEAEKLQDDRDNFLNLALEGYQRSLVIGGKHDLRVVFRLVCLWFNLSSREHVLKAMMRTIEEVQSYKFIPLVYQIASRLGSSKDTQESNNFQIALVSLVRKMAIDHPYHTIFQLLALANGDRVKDKQRSRSSFVVDMDKKVAAENLLHELSSYHGPLIRQMKQLVEAYIKLAELEMKKEDTNKRITLPREVRSLRQLELVPVVTATIPVDPGCLYGEGSFPYFKGLADSITVMNGINAPKVIECFGSDGSKYRQLAKSGNDDLRQDAVMEQFFGLVNTFLQNHRDSWKRRLRIRTYKVVPFTPTAGVVEWVDRTIPLGEYLLGSTRSGGAHGRYGNEGWSFLQCREYMTSEKDKREAFLRVCDNFRPVMHHFFLERFLLPADWFERRLSYTRSVAASSMVGYIVGLGDRHSMNILIDQDTAEVVHIDLGVAFEQGLMLKTPERVPFRLTRDIIDGMGVTGVEGVFRRCCEETLSVMRANKEELLTIIEVFIHDPLYKWALSPLKALQRQKETDDDIESCLDGSQDAYEGNKDAARATLRVKQKLEGYEEGEMRSVQGQVQQLIKDAVDVDRLCQMFPGWGAWL